MTSRFHLFLCFSKCVSSVRRRLPAPEAQTRRRIDQGVYWCVDRSWLVGVRYLKWLGYCFLPNMFARGEDHSRASVCGILFQQLTGYHFEGSHQRIEKFNSFHWCDLKNILSVCKILERKCFPNICSYRPNKFEAPIYIHTHIQRVIHHEFWDYWTVNTRSLSYNCHLRSNSCWVDLSFCVICLGLAYMVNSSIFICSSLRWLGQQMEMTGCQQNRHSCDPYKFVRLQDRVREFKFDMIVALHTYQKAPISVCKFITTKRPLGNTKHGFFSGQND